MDATLAAWLSGLDEAYLSDWANRGLLRRGRKLAETLTATDCEFHDTGATGAIDNQRQTLTAAGFEHLNCSCPAAGPCHHLIAFLLCLQGHPDLATGTDTASETLAPWLDDNLDTLSKQLGRAYYQRAQRLLVQAVDCELEQTANALVATVIEQERYTVRIPRATGLAAATCTCGALGRCVHRALAVLNARQQAGLYDPLADLDQALAPAQQEAVSRIRQWLQELVALGSAGLSRALIERGEALATVARQADLPLLASQLGGLVALQNDELAGRSYLQVDDIANRLAQLWVRLRALQQTPLPQPLSRLAGEHRQHYRLVQNLELIGVAAEQWYGQSGYWGLTLYLYAPAEDRWYRHTQARPQSQTDGYDWSPERCWRQARWSGALAYRAVPGARFTLRRGWATASGQLSGRDGTLIDIIDSGGATARVPIQAAFGTLAQQYAAALAADPVASMPRLPVLIAIQRADEPEFSTIEQRWSQRVYDGSDQWLELSVPVYDTQSAALRDTLRQRWQRGQRWRQVFGLLSSTLTSSTLVVKPISIYTDGKAQWQHLTLPQK